MNGWAALAIILVWTTAAMAIGYLQGKAHGQAHREAVHVRNTELIRELEARRRDGA